MENILSIGLVQTNLRWKDKTANLALIHQLVESIHQPIDILLLPELFNTAFCIDDLSLAEDESGATLAFMQQLSIQQACAVGGSFLFKENENVYNRFFLVDKNEVLGVYDKHYLFSLVNENQLLQNGNKKACITYKGWKLQPFICYDLRFPAWCQNNDNAEVQLYVASWPQKRIHHWQILLQARAIENQCYTVGVNRIGDDFYNNAHNGHSSVFDFTGTKICDMQSKDGIDIVTLSKVDLEAHKKRYPFWKDREKE